MNRVTEPDAFGAYVEAGPTGRRGMVRGLGATIVILLAGGVVGLAAIHPSRHTVRVVDGSVLSRAAAVTLAPDTERVIVGIEAGKGYRTASVHQRLLID